MDSGESQAWIMDAIKNNLTLLVHLLEMTLLPLSSHNILSLQDMGPHSRMTSCHIKRCGEKASQPSIHPSCDLNTYKNHDFSCCISSFRELRWFLTLVYFRKMDLVRIRWWSRTKGRDDMIFERYHSFHGWIKKTTKVEVIYRKYKTKE